MSRILSFPGLWIPRRRPARIIVPAARRPRRTLEHLMTLAFKGGHLAWAGSGHLATGCGATTVQAARYCPSGLSGLYLPSSAMPSPFGSKYYVKRGSDGACFYFDPNDSPVADTGQPRLQSPYSSVSACTDSSCAPLVCGCQAGFDAAAKTITATFSGLSYMACQIPVGGSGYTKFLSTLGTYSQAVSGCRVLWNFGPFQGYNGNDCGSFNSFANVGISVAYNGTADGWGVGAATGAALGGVFDGPYTPWPDCTQPLIVENAYTSFNQPGGGNGAWGGICTLTLS